MTDSSPKESLKQDTTISDAGSSQVGGSFGNDGQVLQFRGDNNTVINVRHYKEHPKPPETSESQSNPYRGLLPFGEEHSNQFFGRKGVLFGNALTDVSLVQLIKNQRLTIVTGASGSGKTSLIFAGLVPEIKKENWIIAKFRPGSPNNNPFYGLACSFSELIDSDVQSPNVQSLDEMVESIKRSSYAVYVEKVLQKSPGKKLLLVVDQFEELYTLCKSQRQAEQQNFVDTLLAPARDKLLTIILIIRADFIDTLTNQIQNDWSNIQPWTLDSMSREELRAVIEEPAKLAGRNLEEGLTEKILEDVGNNESGNLPLLQFAMERLWEKHQGQKLTHHAYEEIGGLKKALINHADKVYQEFDELEQKKQVQRIFVQLVNWDVGLESVRKFATHRELGEKCWCLITHDKKGLCQSRLVVINKDERTGEEVVEIVHEILIREWQRLREWVDSQKAILTQKREIEMSASQWKNIRKSKDSAYLLRGSKLLEAIELDKNLNDQSSVVTALSDDAKALIKASQKSQKRSGRILFGSIFSSIVLLIIVGLFFAFQQKQYQYAQIRAGVSELELVPAAEDLKLQAEALAKENKTEEALAEYRAVLNFAYLLQKQIQQKFSEFSVSDKTKSDIGSLLKRTEEELTTLVVTKRLPILKTQLQADPAPDVGTVNRSNNPENKAKNPPDPSKYADQRFTPGALHTTYAILMTDFGVNADSNKNGLLTNKEEAERIPCPLLIALEKLWREETENACGFYNASANSTFGSPKCAILENQSLLELVLVDSHSSAASRINFCKLAPKEIKYE